MSRFRKLTPSFLEISNNPSKYNWEQISGRTDLSVNFIRKFQNKIDWKILSRSNMSEKFMDEFEAKIDWSKVYSYELSEPFVIKFFDRLDVANISCNINLSFDFYKKYRNHLRWDLVSATKKINKEFVDEFCNEIDFDAFVKWNWKSSKEIKDFCKMFI